MKADRSYRLWSFISTGGMILVAFLSAGLVFSIPFSDQWLNSFFCATVCFFSLWFQSKSLDASRSGERLSQVLLLLGIAEVILGVLFLRAMVQSVSLQTWMSGLILLSPAAYAGACGLLFMSIFPRAEKRAERPAPDPLSAFSQPVQEMMKEGRKRVGNPVAFSMLAFTILGSIAYIISVLRSGEGNPYLFLIPAALGYLLGFTLYVILTYQWQRSARRSGIPEEELKAAAKAAHLWWPKTRDAAELEKPGKFTGS